jgi:serine/threonine protein kinase
MTSTWRIPGWRVLGRIARGGTADLLLAEPDVSGDVTPAALVLGLAQLHQRVVLKRLYPHLAAAEEFVRMFVDEVQLMTCMRSPHVVDVYDLDEDDDTFFAVMELVDGPSASAALRLAQRRAVAGVDVDVVCAICARVARALAVVHGAVSDDGAPVGLVHRDVSPQNVLLGRDGAVKLGDFGVALSTAGRKAGLLRAQDTGAGVLKGKVSFLSPEQVRGAVVDVRADFFALGATAHALVTGHPPFRADTDVATLDAILHAPPPALPSTLPAAFTALLDALLAKTPSDRPADAAVVAAAFAAVCDDDRRVADFVVGLGLPSLRA